VLVVLLCGPLDVAGRLREEMAAEEAFEQEMVVTLSVPDSVEEEAKLLLL
jgi:hypothetical protein